MMAGGFRLFVVIVGASILVSLYAGYSYHWLVAGYSLRDLALYGGFFGVVFYALVARGPPGQARPVKPHFSEDSEAFVEGYASERGKARARQDHREKIAEEERARRDAEEM
ncbi:hypothetical protein ACFLRF_04615 [Candidatus Altiarchaeota archaeon]